MTRRYLVGRGLSKREALRRARRLDRGRDYRGFKYDKRTGQAWLT